ncbi:MAG: hypothetical protein ACRC5T_01230 [Cetobacterium sp.]
MRKISMIRNAKAEYSLNRHKRVSDAYDIQCFSKSETISNLADLISDIDLLVEVGYKKYLRTKEEELPHLEDIIMDTMHYRNLFSMNDEKLSKIVLEERRAYVRRADLKSELQFLQTNATHINKLVEVLKRMSIFNEKKNQRIYTPKRLMEFIDVMNDDEGEADE